MALSTPVWASWTLRGWYMNRQMITGADERDRHRQEDHRLGDVLAAGPIGKNGGGETEGRCQAGDDDDPPDVVEQRSAQHGQHGARSEECSRRRSGATTGDPTRRPAWSVRPLTTPMSTPAAMTATPNHHSWLVKMFGQLSTSKKFGSLEHRLVVVEPDVLGAVATLEGDVDRPHQRDEQAAGDERQRRGHEDPRPRALLDLASLGRRPEPPRGRHAARSRRAGRRWRAWPRRWCRRRRTRRRPTRRRASRSHRRASAASARRCGCNPRRPLSRRLSTPTPTPMAVHPSSLAQSRLGCQRSSIARATSTPRPAKPATATGTRARSSRGALRANMATPVATPPDYRPRPRARREVAEQAVAVEDRGTRGTRRRIRRSSRTASSGRTSRSNSLLAPTNRPVEIARATTILSNISPISLGPM